MTFRRTVTVLLASAALASCNMAPTTGITAQAPWAEFTKATIDSWLKVDPYFAVYQGAHQFDGQFADWSPAGLKARGDFLRKVIADAKGYDKVDGRDKFERDYMVKVAEGQLFWLETADQPHTNPGWYVGNFDPNVYLTREYADKPTRAKALAQFLEGVPAAAAQISGVHSLVVRASGSALRSFTLPDTAKADQVMAEFKDGVLNVRR